MQFTMESSRDSRWENLPPELTLSIVGRTALPDVARARGVCRQWAQVLRKPISVLQPRIFPFLILSSEQGERSESCTFLSLPERRCYRVSPLPEIGNRRFIGSKGNWLVTLNPALEPRLLNPFTREEAPLPSLLAIPDQAYRDMCVRLRSISTWVGFYYQVEQTPIPFPINLFRDLCIRKIVPSSDSGPPGVVLVVYGLINVRLALAWPGDCAWTLVPIPSQLQHGKLSDAVYNTKDGMFYAVTQLMTVLSFHPDNPEHVMIILDAPSYPMYAKSYLVFSSDDILLVQRGQRPCDNNYDWVAAYSDIRQVNSTDFLVFKFTMSWEEGELTGPPWTELDHLSGRCLMLGNNHSVSLSPEQVPGLKGNCIYFTDDYPDNLSKHYREHPRDVGVFDMELRTFDRFLTNYSCYTWPPPIWYLPSQHLY